MNEILSIAQNEAVTCHWRVTDFEMARRMAARLAARLGNRESVKIRRVFEVIQIVEEFIDVPPPA